MNTAVVLICFLLIGSIQSIRAVNLKCNFTFTECVNFTNNAHTDCFTCQIQNANIGDEMINFDLSNNPKTDNDVVRLEVTSSSISYFPKNLFQIFTKLTFLYINTNEGFTRLKADYFKNGEMLNQFWVWDTDLTDVPGNVFAQAPNLQVIGLQSNEIKAYHKNSFAGLFKLEVLYLHSNLVKTLDKDTFKDNIKLRFISLASNRIKTLSFSVFAHLNLLNNLILSKNACIDQTFDSISGRLERQLMELCGHGTIAPPVMENNNGKYEQLLRDLEDSKQTRKNLEAQLLKTRNEIYNLEKYCKLQVKNSEEYKVRKCIWN